MNYKTTINVLIHSGNGKAIDEILIIFILTENRVLNFQYYVYVTQQRYINVYEMSKLLLQLKDASKKKK